MPDVEIKTFRCYEAKIEESENPPICTAQHGFFANEENFPVNSTPNGVLTAHTEWLPGL